MSLINFIMLESGKDKLRLKKGNCSSVSCAHLPSITEHFYVSIGAERVLLSDLSGIKMVKSNNPLNKDNRLLQSPFSRPSNRGAPNLIKLGEWMIMLLIVSQGIRWWFPLIKLNLNFIFSFFQFKSKWSISQEHGFSLREECFDLEAQYKKWGYSAQKTTYICLRVGFK